MSKYNHNAMMAQLHIAPKDLGMDEETRRDFIASRFKGKRSSKDLSFTEKFALLQAFKDAGWKPKRKGIRNKNKVDYKKSTSRLMIALWNELFKLGKMKNKDSSGKKLTENIAMERWIANQTREPGQQLPKQKSPDTLGTIWDRKIIERLKKMLNEQIVLLEGEILFKHLNANTYMYGVLNILSDKSVRYITQEQRLAYDRKLKKWVIDFD